MGSRLSGVFRCGAYFLYRCVLNGAQVAVEMSVQGSSREAHHPDASRSAQKGRPLSHNVPASPPSLDTAF